MPIKKIDLSLNRADLVFMLKTARKYGALRVRAGDVEIELGPLAAEIKTQPTTSPTQSLLQALDSESAPSADDLLFHSAPDTFSTTDEPK